MRAITKGGHGRRVSFSSVARQTRTLLFAAICWFGMSQTVSAQTVYNVSGSWTGSVTEQPATGPFPGGVSATNYMLYQSGSTVIGSGFTTLDGYWLVLAFTGNVSGSTLTLTSTVVSGNLPYGYQGCPGTTTFTIDSTGTQISAPASTCGGNTVNAFTMTGGGWTKQLGSNYCPGCAGSVDVGSGNVNQAFTDYETAGPNRLSFIRSYNSNPSSSFMPSASYRMMGFDHWTTNFDRTLNVVSPTQIVAQRPDGKGVTFNLIGATWTPDTDVDMTLTTTSSTYTLTTHDDTVETYNQVPLVIGQLTNGLLASITSRNGYTQTINRNGSQQITSVTDSYGRSLGFTYNGSGQLSTVTTPDSLVLTYAYSSSGIGTNDRLATVSFNTSPASSKTYNYGNSSYPFALTSITDENGNASKSWSYDSYGRAITDQQAGGAYLVTITYNDSAGTRTVTNALSQPHVYTIANRQNVGKVDRVAVTGTSTVAGTVTPVGYSLAGYIVTVTDPKGYITTYTPNAHGDPTTIVQGSGTSIARTTNITYDTACVHLPSTIVTPGLTMGYTYDSSCNPLTKTLTDTTTQSVPYSTNGQTRTWHYTWSNFLPHTVQSPNGNTTTFTYDSSGALVSTTNALSQSIQVTSHTNGGRPLIIVDPNSVTTTLTYSTRNWLLTKAVATAAGNLTTSYAYDPAGNLTSLTQPDGSVLTNTYDIANRLTKAADSFGNSLNYTLDALGDATGTQAKDTGGVVKKSITATFDSLGRKIKDTNGTNWNTGYGYDNNGNLNTYSPPSQPNSYILDALNRRTTEAQYPYPNITYTYDGHDRPLTVTSRNGSITSYVYNGFGDKIQEASPDRGTIVYQYDADGNLTSKTDALSIVANYTYDALDRLLTTSYPASASENVTYTYDQTGTGFAFGIGRLTSLTDMAGSLTRTYDERGNIITEKRVNGGATLTTTYGYDAVSRLAAITYPSGALVTYVRDAIGRITSVTDKPSGASTATTLASSVTYLPFGPYLSFTYGNGIAETLTRDGNYDLLTLKDIGTATVQNISNTLAVEDQLSTYVENLNPSTGTINAGYDGLYRMSGVSTYQQGAISYIYDNNGNRTAIPQQHMSYTYSPTTSNRLATIVNNGVTTTVTTDARGSITGFSPGYGAAAVTSLSYNNAGRLVSVSNAGGVLGSYLYDARGFRYSKTVGANTTLFTHSPGGVLLEESTGGTATDYVYLNDRPIAMLTGTTFTYLHGNRLGTPQVATNASQAVVWKLTTLPFGETLTSSGTATINLRMPGQYYDAETGFNHNVERDYVPALGRYLESDPLGLAAGLNTYAYAGLRPWTMTDPLGLSYYWNGSSCYDTTLPPPGFAKDPHACDGQKRTKTEAFFFGDGKGSWGALQPLGIFASLYLIDYLAARDALAELSDAELGVLREAQAILASPEFAEIRAAYEAGESIEVVVGGRTILYSLDALSSGASGMSLFGENGFVITARAFMSQAETAKTVLHELYRLAFSESVAGISADLATAETESAFQFAQKTWWLLRHLW